MVTQPTAQIPRTRSVVNRRGAASVEFIGSLLAIVVPTVLIMTELVRVMATARQMHFEAQPRCIAQAAAHARNAPRDISMSCRRTVQPLPGTRRVFGERWSAAPVHLNRTYWILGGCNSE